MVRSNVITLPHGAFKDRSIAMCTAEILKKSIFRAKTSIAVAAMPH